MRLLIKDNVNPLLNILYDGGEKLIKENNIDLRLFIVDDKYIIQNYTLDKSVELDKENFTRELNMFYNKESIIKIEGLSISSFIAMKCGMTTPLILLTNTKNNGVQHIFDLRTFKYNDDIVKKLDKQLKHIRLEWLNIFIPLILCIIIALLVFILER